ncbi:diguanylate cyclase [Thalassotalea mangrovi]|uniref:diguanylate cyclase n=1 Tax=Thalassotalea mangrovi TaxID=2572245 RepID=A0A4U1B9T1_9GAMM|nr:diguanylate cyclase [Thalassotalea mangrovi]TKB47547.1 diguanylate cyclase [Thalassotalea mangrovi]
MKKLSVKIKEQYKPLLFVGLISLFGFALNYYPIPLFNNIELVLGNVAFVIVAMRFGMLYSLLCALIVCISLTESTGHPFGFWLFGLEAVFIAWLRSRGWYVLYADLLFWFVLGMPLTALLLFYQIDMPEQLWFLTTIKQAFNGLVYTCLAGLVVYFFPSLFDISYQQQPRTVRTLQSQLVYASSLVISFSIITISIFVSHKVIKSQHDIIQQNIDERKHYFVHSTENYLRSYQSAIENLAIMLSNNPSYWHQGDDARQRLAFIDKFHQKYPDFLGIAVVNANQQVIYTSPGQLLEQVAQQVGEVRVTQEEFFIGAQHTQGSYLSKVFISNYLGGKPIITISQGVMLDDAAEHPYKPVLAGALDSRRFSQLVSAQLSDKMSYIITDQIGNVVFASEQLNIAPLKPIQFAAEAEYAFGKTQLVRFKVPGGESPEYFLSKAKLKNGWQAYVLVDSSSVVKKIEQEYILVFALLILAFLIAVSLAQRIGFELTQPMVFILKQLQKFDRNNKLEFAPLFRGAPQEVILLYDELQRNKTEIHEYQTELENKVAERTDELERANEKLTQLAQKDGLTGVFNRRYFDEHFGLHRKHTYRNRGNMAVMIIDLDHFKEVNDQHGHLAGDECLRVVSEIMSEEFSRETDLIARFGGEEFVLMVTQISEQNLSYKLERLRRTIAATVIYDERNQPFHVTASIGAILAPATYSDQTQDWIQLADKKLYQAKREGRNQVCIEICQSRENDSKDKSEDESAETVTLEQTS